MSNKTVLRILAFVLFITIATMVVGCSSDDEVSDGDAVDKEMSSATPAPSESIKITIGNHSDLTGVSSNAMILVTRSLEDMADYYNEENLIPGVELEVITYDGQYNPAYDIPGYHWLKERGADVFFTGIAPASITLKPLLEDDQMVMFTVTPPTKAFQPPGRVFAAGNTLAQWDATTVLKWVTENDPDFPADRPAKVGGAFWSEDYGADCLAGAKGYALAHPEQYEWEGGFLNEWSFIWDTEVQKLKDCDYVFPPIPLNQFVRQYRDAGYTAKFIGTDAHLAFLGMIDDADLWEELDGMWFIKCGQWWNDEGEIVELTKQLLQKYHPDEADSIIRSGISYLGTQQVYIMLELIKETVETVGVDNFFPSAIYDTAQSFSITVDGCPHSYGETKRTSNDGLAVYQMRAAEKDIFRVHVEWLPIVK
ncbi:ABC transporter substrate-binding protein [Chloroflexota bacterium]